VQTSVKHYRVNRDKGLNIVSTYRKRTE